MRTVLTLAAAVLALNFVSTPAKALEMDQQPSREQIELSRDLPTTLIVRVNNQTQQVEVAHVYDRLDTDAQTRSSVTKKKMKKMSVKDKMRGKARRGGEPQFSSWLFGFNLLNWLSPTYYYSGYSYPYSSYYSYPYNDYTYYYYSYPYGSWY